MLGRATLSLILAAVTTVGCGYAALMMNIGMPPPGTRCYGSQYDHPGLFSLLFVVGIATTAGGSATVVRAINESKTFGFYAVCNGVMILGIIMFLLSFTFIPVQFFCALLNSAL